MQRSRSALLDETELSARYDVPSKVDLSSMSRRSTACTKQNPFSQVPGDIDVAGLREDRTVLLSKYIVVV